MALPVGAFVAPSVQPQQAPVESLDSVIRADTAGINAGNATPNTLGAIAQGVSQGVDNYIDMQARLTQQELREIDLKRAREEEAIIGDADTRLRRQTIDAKAVEIENLKRKQLEARELQNILTNGSITDVNNAFSSGKYSQVIADRQLGPAVLSAGIARGMDPRIANAYKDAFLRGQKKSYADKMREMHTKTLEQGEVELAGSGFDATLAATSGIDRTTAIKRGKLYEEGTVEIDPLKGKLIKQKNGGFSISEGEGTGNYILVDETSGQVLATGIDKDTRKAFIKVKGASELLGDTVYNDPPQARAVDQSLRQTGQEKPNPAAEAIQQLQSSTGKLSTNNFRTLASSQRLIDPLTGAPRVVDSPVLQASLAKSVGLSSIEGLEKDVQNLLSLASASPTEMTQNAESIKTSLDTVVSRGLSEQYQQQKDLLAPTYNQGAVEKHNKDVRKALQSIQSGSTEYSGDATSDILKEVDTPEELYVLKNYNKLRKSALQNLGILRDTYARQNAQAISNDSVRDRIAATVNKYR